MSHNKEAERVKKRFVLETNPDAKMECTVCVGTAEWLPGNHEDAKENVDMSALYLHLVK